MNSNSFWLRLFFLCMLGMLSFQLSFGESSFANNGATLQASGRYVDIFSNGAPAKTNNYHFVALTAFNGWKISVTNANQPKEWGVMRYDGTNIYTLGTDALNGYKIYGYVFPGEFYVPEAALDSVKLFFPWMAFYLTPQMIKNFDRKGIIDIPPPWGKRYSLRDYGFKWKTRYFQDDRIIQRIEAVRDSTLDLKTEEDELRRASINYAFEYSSREHRLEMLRSRKEIPDGFVRADYECENVYKTNNWIIPLTAKFAQYTPTFNPSNPIRLVFEMFLQVEDIKLLQNTDVSDVISPAKASVSDYRYQATNNRTKFNYATYTLDAGDPFPSGQDPKLLAQANAWLKDGPPYDAVQSKRSKILVGMLTLTIVTSGLLVFWLRTKKQIETSAKLL
jgi:hypothetical protein